MQVEIVWGDAIKQTLIELDVAATATVGDALEQAIGAGQLPRDIIDFDRVGIFGRLCAVERVLQAGDRIELYRPLQADPKEVRRALAEVERAKKGTVV